MKLNIAACQMEITPGHPDENFTRIRSRIEEAKANEDDIVIFPEMAIPGYLIGDEWENKAFVNDCYLYNELVAEASEDITIVWGNVDVQKDQLGEDGRIRKFNTAFVAQNGQMVGRFHKTLQPNYREFDDDRHFYSSRKLAQDQKKDLEDYLKPLSISINGEERKIGITLCEDMWSNDYSIQPIKTLLSNGAEFIINISCSPWTWRKNDKRHRIVQKRLKDHPAPLVYVNNTGIQNNGKNVYLFDGKTTIYNSDGSLHKVAQEYQDEVVRTELFGDKKERMATPALSDEKDNEQLLKGLIYGTRKFFEAIKALKVVIGISGGVDSSLSAYLLCRALGAENVYAVNMPSRFNSEITKGLAHQIAETLEMNYAIVPIQESFEYTVKQLNDTTFEQMNGSGETEEVVLKEVDKENIQARDRGSRILAGVASALGAVVVNNGNKSETCMGYATLYGDTNGAIAPIADLYKTQVYELCNYINSVEEQQIFPDQLFEIPASAELNAKQNIEEGEGDPFYYPYHDKLMWAFVEHRLDPEDILEYYMEGDLEKFLQIDPGTISEYFESDQSFVEDLEQNWRLFKINFFKRIQAPPIVTVSKRAFGFDLRESQIGVHFTRKYQALKKDLLEKETESYQ